VGTGEDGIDMLPLLADAATAGNWFSKAMQDVVRLFPASSMAMVKSRSVSGKLAGPAQNQNAGSSGIIQLTRVHGDRWCGILEHSVKAKKHLDKNDAKLRYISVDIGG